MVDGEYFYEGVEAGVYPEFMLEVSIAAEKRGEDGSEDTHLSVVVSTN